MPISQELLEIMCCPRTKVPLRMLSEEELAKLNEQIKAGGVKYHDDSEVDKPLDEGLITEDGETVYRIDDSIPVMLIDKGISMAQIYGE